MLNYDRTNPEVFREVPELQANGKPLTPIEVVEVSRCDFRNTKGIICLTVEADPTKPKPFKVGYNDISVEDAATIAYGILTVLRNAAPSSFESEKAIDECLRYLVLRANLGLIPF